MSDKLFNGVVAAVLIVVAWYYFGSPTSVDQVKQRVNVALPTAQISVSVPKPHIIVATEAPATVSAPVPVPVVVPTEVPIDRISAHEQDSSMGPAPLLNGPVDSEPALVVLPTSLPSAEDSAPLPACVYYSATKTYGTDACDHFKSVEVK